MPYRIQTFSVRLLELHALYCELVAEGLILKCQGKDEEAKEALAIARDTCGKYEVYFQTVYDHYNTFNGLNRIFSAVTKNDAPAIY